MPTFNSPRPILALIGFIVTLLIIVLSILGVGLTLPTLLPYVLLLLVFACLIW